MFEQGPRPVNDPTDPLLAVAVGSVPARGAPPVRQTQGLHRRCEFVGAVAPDIHIFGSVLAEVFVEGP